MLKTDTLTVKGELCKASDLHKQLEESPNCVTGALRRPGTRKRVTNHLAQPRVRYDGRSL